MPCSSQIAPLPPVLNVNYNTGGREVMKWRLFNSQGSFSYLCSAPLNNKAIIKQSKPLLYI